MVNAPEANAETKKATMEMKTPTAKERRRSFLAMVFAFSASRSKSLAMKEVEATKSGSTK